MKKIRTKRIYLYSHDRFRFWIDIQFQSFHPSPLKRYTINPEIENHCAFCNRIIHKQFFKQNGNKYCSEECHEEERNVAIIIRVAKREAKKVHHTSSNYQYGNKLTHFEFNLDNSPRKIRERI